MTEQDKWEPPRPEPRDSHSPKDPPPDPDVADLIPIDERGKGDAA